MFPTHIKSTYVSFINRNKCCRVEIIVICVPKVGPLNCIVIVLQIASAYFPNVIPSRLFAVVSGLAFT